MSLSYEEQLRTQDRLAQRYLREVISGLPKPDVPPPVPVADEVEAERVAREKRIEELYAELEELEGNQPPFLARRIAKAVAKAHGLTFAQLKTQRRFKELVIARQHAAYTLDALTDLSRFRIARLLGYRDHTTVIQAIRQHAARMKGEKYVRNYRSPAPDTGRAG